MWTIIKRIVSMKYLTILVFSFTCLFGQFDFEPKITTIDGEIVYYYNNEQMDSLLVKLSTMKVNKEELGLINELVKSLTMSIVYRDTMLVIKEEYIGLLQEQNDDYRVLVKSKNKWWDNRIVGFILGVAVTYFAVDLATNIN